MKQMTLADWMPEDCPEFDLSQHMNPPETLDRDQVEEDHLPTDRPTNRFAFLWLARRVRLYARHFVSGAMRHTPAM